MKGTYAIVINQLVNKKKPSTKFCKETRLERNTISTHNISGYFWIKPSQIPICRAYSRTGENFRTFSDFIKFAGLTNILCLQL